jgi:hypothetical protein
MRDALNFVITSNVKSNVLLQQQYNTLQVSNRRKTALQVLQKKKTVHFIKIMLPPVLISMTFVSSYETIGWTRKRKKI